MTLEEKIAAAENKLKLLKQQQSRKERKRRTHQMCAFAGDIEKAYENAFGSKLFLEKNQEEIDRMVKTFDNWFHGFKEKGFINTLKQESHENEQSE